MIDANSGVADMFERNVVVLFVSGIVFMIERGWLGLGLRLG